ncbi:unnamed protein product [Rangifer tarandus platyrhynchus]|uniref:Uncharacterized protein n=1 Tax=Rangifer tarandus platyrhynchus TaxID=3082113 RepID=A0ABN8ZJ53_RANTA|nr:unnamed protein product [Rangifer tarandus platyrhynchus]
MGRRTPQRASSRPSWGRPGGQPVLNGDTAPQACVDKPCPQVPEPPSSTPRPAPQAEPETRAEEMSLLGEGGTSQSLLLSLSLMECRAVSPHKGVFQEPSLSPCQEAGSSRASWQLAAAGELAICFHWDKPTLGGSTTPALISIPGRPNLPLRKGGCRWTSHPDRPHPQRLLRHQAALVCG